MKSKIKRHSRSVIAVILTISMLISCMMVGLIATDAARVTKDSTVGALPTTIYFKPSTNWAGASAKFKYNFNTDGSGWISGYMTAVEGEDGYYKADVPSGKTHVMFLRINPSDDSDQWAYSKNFMIPSDGNNCVELSSGDVWANTDGTWTTFVEETKYAVTIAAGTGGTIENNVASMNVGATAKTLPKAVPDFGYKFNGWTVNNDDILKLTDADSADAATISATTTGGVVTANFEPDDSLDLYIVGRFRYRTTAGGTYTYTEPTNSHGWSLTSTNIKLVYQSGTEYALNTLCTIGELTTNNDNPWSGSNTYFCIRDAAGSGTNYMYSSKTALTATNKGTKYQLSSSNNDNEKNLYFNASSSTDGPVTIHFDTATKEIWFTTDYDLTIASSGHGTATMTKDGTSVNSADGTHKLTALSGSNEVSLAASDIDSGYRFVNWTATSGAANVSFTNANSASTTATVTGEATIQANFEEITYAVTASVSPAGAGSVKNASDESVTSLQVGNITPVEINASANTHFTFNHWETTGNVTLQSAAATNQNTIKATDTGTVTAVFEEETKYAINVTGGSASSASTYAGETVTLTADPPEGKKVDPSNPVTATKHGDSSTVVSVTYAAGTGYTFTMPGYAVDVTFNFVDLATITVSTEVYTDGSASSAGGVIDVSPKGRNVKELESIHGTAAANTNYRFVKWQKKVGTGEWEDLTTDESFTFIAGTENLSFRANFEYHPVYPVNITINPEANGSIDDISVDEAGVGDTVTVLYTADYGYRYVNLTDSDNGDAVIATTSATDGKVVFNVPAGKASDINYRINLESTIGTSSKYKYYGYKVGPTLENAVGDYNGKWFSTAKYENNDAKPFSFYKVSGRSESVQGFAVEDTGANTDLNTIVIRDESESWGQNQPKIKFYNNSNTQVGSETQMKWAGENIYKDDNKRSWIVTVPYGATMFKVGDSNGQNYSVNYGTLNPTYNVFNYKNGNFTAVENSNYANATHKFFFNNYSDSTGSKKVYNAGKAFGSNITISKENYNIVLSSHESTSHSWVNQRNLQGATVNIDDPTLDYYIIVYHAGVNYGTINGETVNLEGYQHPVIVAQTVLPGQTIDPGEQTKTPVKVIAKDGAVRRKGASRNPGSDQDYSTFEKYADTVLTTADYSAATTDFEHSRVGYSVGTTYDYASKVPKGTTLHIRTTVDDKHKDKIYVRAFCINGVTYQLHDYNSSGVYTEDFTIPDDWKDNYVEITPIYYNNTNTNLIRFSVQGYDDSVMNSGWGNTLYVYPYYSGLSRADNSFGGYPGQPMIFYKGEYFTEIPATYSSKTVKGMTLNNGYWDDIHLCVAKEVSKHHQTYDYDDFYKIFKEYPEYNDSHSADQRRIICSFKFRTAHENSEPSSLDASKINACTNGWELLTNYEGEPVDIYGKKLTGDNADVATATTNAEASGLRVISQRYKSNCAGHYATEWAVYSMTSATSGTKITRIVPSALVINENNIKNGAPTRGSGITEAQVSTYMNNTYNSDTAKFADNYYALDNYRDKPVLITYEVSKWGGSDPAERCDVRWYWTYTDTSISASMRVAYSDDNGASFELDGADPLTEGEAAPTSGAHVSFGATSTSNVHTATSTVGGDDFQLAADTTTSNNYKFVGWYAEREGVSQFVSSEPVLTVPASSNVKFEARYVKSVSGRFTISHLVHPNSTGNGTPHISAQLKVNGVNSGDPVTADNGSVTFENLSFGAKQTIEVTLTANPNDYSTHDNFYATLTNFLQSYKAGYISGLTIDRTTDPANPVATFTITVNKLFNVSDQSTATQTVFSMTNYSKYSVKEHTFNNILLSYKFPVRVYGDRAYKITSVTVTGDEMSKYFPTYVKSGAQIDLLTPEFVMSRAPFEDIFRKEFTWDEDTVEVGKNGETLTGFLQGNAPSNDTVTAVVYNGDDTNTYTTTYMQNFENDSIRAVDKTKETTPLYFKQWNIYKLEDMAKVEDGESVDKVAICFSENFNYCGFEDYYVVAEYSDTEIKNRHELVSGLVDSASLLSVTRSHWNDTAIGDAWKSAEPGADDPSGSGKYYKGHTDTDRIYIDFVLAWSNSGKLVMEDRSNTFGFDIEVYDDGTLTNTVHKTVTNSDVDNKNRLEYTFGLDNTAKNASSTRTYKIYATRNDQKVGTATPQFSVYEVGLPQGKQS